MYIYLPTPDKKCSKCGAVNQTEDVIVNRGFVGTITKLRCTVCGHEKITSEVTAYPYSDDSGWKVYTADTNPKEEEF